MEKIQRVSRLFRFLFQLLYYVVPLIITLFWMALIPRFALSVPIGSIFVFQGMSVTINAISLSLAFLVSMLPGAVVVFALRQLVTLFKNYENGKIFILNNVKCYKKLGYALFSWFFVSILYRALISYVLTFQNPRNYRLIRLAVSHVDIFVILASGLVLLIAWIMQEAYLISEEQSLTI